METVLNNILVISMIGAGGIALALLNDHIDNKLKNKDQDHDQ